MTALSQPFGLRPVGNGDGPGSITNAVTSYIASGYGSNIGYYTPITITGSGVINVATTSSNVDGVFLGWRPLVGANSGAITNIPLNQWTAGTTYSGNAQFYVKLFTNNPADLYEIQANGSVIQTSVGDQANLVNPGNVNGLGFSTAALSSSVVGAGNNAQFQIVDLAPAYNTSNAWGDAYTIVRVRPSKSGFFASYNAF